MSGNARVKFIEALITVPANQRQGFAETAKLFIEALVKVPADRRQGVAEAAKLLSTEGMDKYARIRIIKALAKVPADQLQYITEEAKKKLIADNVDEEAQVMIIEGFCRHRQVK
jgi:hypothetical protein